MNFTDGNTSQQHGIDVENKLKGAWRFSGACDAFRKRNGVVDIEAKHDSILGLNTNIKTVAENGWAGMSDATRFCEIQIPIRFLMVEWVQTSEDIKTFKRIHEIIATPAIFRELRGSISAEEVERWHLAIAGFPLGKKGADEARLERDRIMAKINGRHHKAMRFDFKIGNEEERRLQVSLKLPHLIQLVREITEDGPEYRASNGNTQPHYVLHDKFFDQFPIPFDLRSPSRRIIKIKQTPDKEHESNLFNRLPALRVPMSDRPRNPRRQDHVTGGMDEDLQRELFSDF